MKPSKQAIVTNEKEKMGFSFLSIKGGVSLLPDAGIDAESREGTKVTPLRLRMPHILCLRNRFTVHLPVATL